MLPRFSALGRRGDRPSGKGAAEMNEIIAISIVPADAFALQSQLHALNLGAMLTATVAKVKSTGLANWGIFGLDVSFNDLSAKGQLNGFQGQVYGFIETNNRQKLRDLLKKAFPPTDIISKTVRTRRFDGTAKGASYALKFEFIRRVSYWDDQCERPCWRTRKVSLKAPEHKELMLALDQVGLAGRMTVIGVSLSKNEKGEITM
jgi:hypothetical protein